jgi:hypothetical protein
MGITHSTARWVAPLSFAIDFAAQQYGMLSSPNMKDVHDANLSFWSPQPYFIAGFFFPQQLFQLAWLYRLWKLDPSKSAKDKEEVQIMVDFVPYYAVGNICIASMTDLSFLSYLFVKIMLTIYSLDGILEFLCAEDSKHIRAHQFLHATLLHLWTAATNEHSLHFLRTHAHRFEDFCWHRSFGLLAQRFRCLF